MKKIFFISALVLGLACAAYADSGPHSRLRGGHALAAAGHYYLTRNISSTNDPVIEVTADNVTLDLNGFEITSSITTNTLIDFTGTTNFTVKNGTLSGGAAGVWQGGAVKEIRAHIENIEINNSFYSAVDIMNAQYIEVIDCRILSPGDSGIWDTRF